MITAIHQYNYKRSEKGKLTQKRYYRSVAKKAADNRWRENNKEKIKAQGILQYRVKKGEIKRQPCEICNKPIAQAHHDDYSQPLNVKWFCNLHHSEYHRDLN